MSLFQDFVSTWKPLSQRISQAKAARFSYTPEAYANNNIEGVDEYDFASDMNVPSATKTELQDTVLSKGFRSSAASINRQTVNHFFGRLSYNVNKLSDLTYSLITSLDEILGKIVYNSVTGKITISHPVIIPNGITGNVTGNASTADKWKTARNISISDANGTNTGTAVVVDGSENETLKLPATIKATLSGNASTATKLATPRKINNVPFDGTEDIITQESPPTPWAQYSGKDIPQLPDNVAGTTQNVTEFTSIPSGWTINERTPVSSFDDNEWQIVSNSNWEGYKKTIPAGSFVIMYIKCISGSTSIFDTVIGNVKTYSASDKWNLFIYYAPTTREIVHYSHSGTYRIKSIYIGTGAYDRLVFDNSYHYRHLLNNAVIPTPQGLYFNGSTSYLRSKEMVTLPDVFTFSATVNFAVNSTTQRVFDIYNSDTDRLLVQINQNTNSLGVVYYNQATSSIIDARVNNFFVDNIDIDTKIEIDFINKTIKFYKNNILFYNTTATELKKPTEGYFYIGSGTGSIYFLLGYMRNIQLYDTTLTDTQRNWLSQGNTPPILYDVTNYETEGYVSIQDADGTNTGEETDVDSNGNRILKLPSTIKASITGSASGNSPTSHASAATTYGVSTEANYGHAKASTVVGSANGVASKGTTPAVFAQSNHVHPTDTSRAPTNHASTAITYGMADASNYGHAKASGTTPKMNGAAAVGAEVGAFARGDHVHPLQTSVSGNAGTADTASKANVRVSLRHGDTFFAKTWTGLTTYDGRQIWTDGDNIYCSSTTNHFVLNKAASTWVAKTWAGLTDFNGENIWTDGDNIYYSSTTKQFVLNKATSTWAAKTWTGLTDFNCSNIWTDGSSIYCSSGITQQFVLNKLTSTWTAKTWAGLTNFYGVYIWTDGNNIYYSMEAIHLVLNKATSTWTGKSWAGLANFNGSQVWTDGDNIYYGSNENQFALNKATSTWVVKTWTGLGTYAGSGYNFWTDGENVYYSSATTQHVLPATRHNYVDDAKYNSLFGTVTKCNSSTLSDRFVFRNE